MHTFKTGLMQANLVLCRRFRKVFITHSISEGNQTRYILPCCLEIWCCAKLGTIGNPRAKKLPNLTSLHYLLTFAPMLDNFKSFQSTQIRGFNSTLINYFTENVLKESIDQFCFNCRFRESSLRNYKRAQHCVLPWFIRFHLLLNRASVLAFSGF